MRSTAQKTLRWKEIGANNSHKYSKTEITIHKGRKLIAQFKRAYLQQLPAAKQLEAIKALYQHIPEAPWSNQHKINSAEFYIAITDTWKKTKSSLYAILARETHSRILEAIKTRNDNFSENKGSMLNSALNRQRKHIDTSVTIYEEEFIEDPLMVKSAINQSAEKWTRKRTLDISDPYWHPHYQPIDAIADNAFQDIDNSFTQMEIEKVISESPNNKAAGPSKITYECWKHATSKVHKSLTILFNRILTEEKTPL